VDKSCSVLCAVFHSLVEVTHMITITYNSFCKIGDGGGDDDNSFCIFCSIHIM